MTSDGRRRRARSSLLGTVPTSLREPLLASFQEIVRNFRERRWEPSELNGGKLAEIVYTILRGHLDGTFAARPAKPPNMAEACRQLERESSSFPRSVRVQIPRMLLALYEIRNNRGVGHAGGDVNPNHMDAVAVLYMAKWIVAELVRIFHNVDTRTADAVVDALVEREVPIVWEVDGVKRVLDPTRSHKEKTLLLLYGTADAVSDADLLRWVEHPRMSDYRKDVLRPLHRTRLIEYNAVTHEVSLSPLGAEYVERSLPLNVPNL